MDVGFSVSDDTQVVLLLCGALGRADSTAQPLTTAQYNVFAKALNSLGKRPADLVSGGLPNEELIAECCAMPNDNGRVQPIEKSRIITLLRRGVTLSAALDKWSSYGVHVISRADAAYPERLRKHLGEKRSPLLYYAGNADLLSGGGMAIVGSRDIREDAANMIRKVVRGSVDLGMNIVSGGARGADQTAMQEAFDCGGKVIGALPCDLLKSCLEPMNREALTGETHCCFPRLILRLDPSVTGRWP